MNTLATLKVESFMLTRLKNTETLVKRWRSHGTCCQQMQASDWWTGLRRKLAVIHLFTNLIMVCIRPSKRHTVPGLTMTHVAEQFSSEGDRKNSSWGSSFQTASFSSAHRCWKNTTCSHTSVDPAKVVCESQRRYNYHRSAHYCV